MENKLTPELIEKARTAKSTEELDNVSGGCEPGECPKCYAKS